jgi:hypothetical protein
VGRDPLTLAEQTLALAVVAVATLACLPLARARRPGRLAVGWALFAAALAVVWDRHEAPYEGPTIVVLTQNHGVTFVDLVVPPALGIAAAVVWRHFRG